MEIGDLNIQAAANLQEWAVNASGFNDATLSNLCAEWSNSNTRRYGAGTQSQNLPYRMYVKKSTSEWHMKNVGLNPVVVEVMIFKVRQNIPYQSNLHYNTSSPANIFNDGLLSLYHLDVPTSADLTLPGYDWHHNNWFCSWFKMVKSYKRTLHPTDGHFKVKLTSVNKGRLLNPVKMVTPFAEYKGAKIMVLKMHGEIVGDKTVAWTGTGSTSKGGWGSANLHLMYFDRHEYSVMDKLEYPTYGILDNRGLEVSTTLANQVMGAMPVTFWDTAAGVMAQPTQGGVMNVDGITNPLIP